MGRTGIVHRRWSFFELLAQATRMKFDRMKGVHVCQCSNMLFKTFDSGRNIVAVQVELVFWRLVDGRGCTPFHQSGGYRAGGSSEHGLHCGILTRRHNLISRPPIWNLEKRLTSNWDCLGVMSARTVCFVACVEMIFAAVLDKLSFTSFDSRQKQVFEIALTPSLRVCPQSVRWFIWIQEHR